MKLKRLLELLLIVAIIAVASYVGLVVTNRLPSPLGAAASPAASAAGTPAATGATPRPSGAMPRPSGATPRPTGATPRPSGGTGGPTAARAPGVIKFGRDLDPNTLAVIGEAT